MVVVAERFERRPIESRVSAFVKIFSVMNSSSEGTYSRCKPWAGFRSASCEFSDYWSLEHACQVKWRE